jgi:hypothetical protein
MAGAVSQGGPAPTAALKDRDAGRGAEIGRHGDRETREHGEAEIGRRGEKCEDWIGVFQHLPISVSPHLGVFAFLGFER